MQGNWFQRNGQDSKDQQSPQASQAAENQPNPNGGIFGGTLDSIQKAAQDYSHKIQSGVQSVAETGKDWASKLPKFRISSKLLSGTKKKEFLMKVEKILSDHAAAII